MFHEPRQPSCKKRRYGDHWQDPLWCADQFIRSRVQIRYLPDDMEHAYVYHHDGEKYFIRRTDKVENGKTKRSNAYVIDYGGEKPDI